MKRIYQAGFKYSLCEDFSFSEVQEKLDHPDEEMCASWVPNAEW